MNTLSYKTISVNKETAKKEWVVVDATDQVVGRLCSKVAKMLRGKYKPSFTPHVDCGDNVIAKAVWGFTPDYFEYSESFFKEFLADPENQKNLKAEFFIPLMVNKLINEGTATVKVLDTTSKWFGVTYSADRPSVVEKIQNLVDTGVYPNKLF